MEYHLKEELEKSKSIKSIFRNIIQDKESPLQWTALVIPQNPPYNQGAFKIQIKLSMEYSSKPPHLTFITPMYHPNVDTDGQVDLPIIREGNWERPIPIFQVITALIALIDEPDLEHPMRAEVAEEFMNDREKFMANAAMHTIQQALERPHD